MWEQPDSSCTTFGRQKFTSTNCFYENQYIKSRSLLLQIMVGYSDSSYLIHPRRMIVPSKAVWGFYLFFALLSGHIAPFHSSLWTSTLRSNAWLQRIWTLFWKPIADLYRDGLTWLSCFSKSHWNLKQVSYQSSLNIAQRWAEVEGESVLAVKTIPMSYSALLTASHCIFFTPWYSMWCGLSQVCAFDGIFNVLPGLFLLFHIFGCSLKKV